MKTSYNVGVMSARVQCRCQPSALQRLTNTFDSYDDDDNEYYISDWPVIIRYAVENAGLSVENMLMHWALIEYLTILNEILI